MMRRVISIAGAAVLCAALSLSPAAQTPSPESVIPSTPVMAELPLDPARRAELETALGKRDYTRAETILVEEINRDPKSPRAARLLVMAGGLFFLDGQYLNSAIAYQKAGAIAPLDERSRFTMTMAFIRLNRRDWARLELEKLAELSPKSALYPYWLARLDYDAQQYQAAIDRLQKVIALDPQMTRAWDNLGLCYDYLGKYDEAVRHYRRAVDLNRRQSQPSPWPPLNLAITLLALNSLTEAETHLREALRYDARLAQAHYQLGQALEKQNRYTEAVQALTQAVTLDPMYPEPHYTLGRIYQRQGEKKKAAQEFETFQKLKKTKTEKSATP